MQPASSSNPLEPYLLQARASATSPAGGGVGSVAEVVVQALEAPGVYVFGELLDEPSVKELADGERAAYHRLLRVFAYGCCKDYAAKRGDLPELSPAMLKKLRHLTIASLAMKSRYISYNTLLSELDLRNVRELEDLVIEVIYNGVIQGKMDQKRQLLEVEHALGRDAPPDALPGMIDLLRSWCDTCENMLHTLETEITLANGRCEANKKAEDSVQKEVSNIKMTLKTAIQSESASPFGQPLADNSECQSEQSKPGKKPSGKMKGLRGSATKSFKPST